MPHDPDALNQRHPSAAAIYGLDARGIAHRVRHAAIFGAFDCLMPGETLRLSVDHDPLPLLAQLTNHYESEIQIEYVTKEPGNVVVDFHRLAGE